MIDFKSAGRTRMANPGGRLLAVILIALAGLAAGCASGDGAGEVGYVAPPESTHAESAPTQVDPGKAGSVVGVWDGLTLANCSTSPSDRCNAQEKITLTMIETDKGLRGYYRCAYGNLNCYNMNETGKIVDATLSGAQLTARVQMPDGTSCVYTGRTAGNGVNGGYTCYGGGSLIESGSWQGHRSY
jgi:hypothetical protein